MPYLGKQPVRGQNRELDDISGSFNGSNAAFTMQVSGSNSSAGSVNQLFISIGGVMQNPGTDFTVAGSTLTFTTPPPDGASFWGLIQGDSVDINTPANQSVTEAKLDANSPTNDYVLTADSSTSGGFKWASAPSLVKLSDPIITGDTDIADGGSVTHTITNWSDDITYVRVPTNCTLGTINTSGEFTVTETADHPSYTIKATSTSLGLADSTVITKTLKTRLSAPTLSSPADSPTNTNVAYTITSTNANDNKLVLNIGSANFTYQSVSVGSASKVGNTVECTGFTTNNPVVTVQFTAEATYSVTAVAKDTTGTWGDSVASAADSITIANTYDADFLVIAGGGGANGAFHGGGGAGGYRNSYGSEASGANSTTESNAALAPGTVYTITVGAGGIGNPNQIYGATAGSDSSISGTGLTTITSVGGAASDGDGGCGGGKSRYSGTGGSGTANQGKDGGDHDGGTAQDKTGGGGGGSSQDGHNATAIDNAGNGGNGLSSSITGSAVTRGGGGGGGTRGQGAGSGGSGGGGAGANSGNGTAGTANTGGGGGGGALSGQYYAGGAGGSGVVIIRMLGTNYSGTTQNGTVTTDGNDKVIVFNQSGTLTG
tara:strand:- start:4011 stop:5816 length:1806 start_codon:yes stop_codon:yes gene_type:complete